MHRLDRNQFSSILKCPPTPRFKGGAPRAWQANIRRSFSCDVDGVLPFCDVCFWFGRRNASRLSFFLLFFLRDSKMAVGRPAGKHRLSLVRQPCFCDLHGALPFGISGWQASRLSFFIFS